MCVHRFEHDVSDISPPTLFTWPFHYVPHRLCTLAAEQVQHYVASRGDWADELSQGKMLGVLVVCDHSGRLGFLAAHSGALCSRNDHAYFVPPVYDLLQRDGEFRRGERVITAINGKIKQLENSDKLHYLNQQAQRIRQNRDEAIADYKQHMAASKSQRDARRRAGSLTASELNALTRESQFQKAELKRLRRHHSLLVDHAQSQLDEFLIGIERLKIERRRRSEALQRRIFGLFVVQNALGQCKNLLEIFGDAVPPSGAGECCAPKLLQHAYRLGVKPLCMAEFWHGRSPIGQVRHHGHYYPACRSKCLPILTFMLQGLPVDSDPLAASGASNGLDVAHDDEWMTIVRKPAGLLTVPGKTVDDSLETRYRREFNVTGPVIVHRLDQETSGLVVLAKSRRAHYALQAMFSNRQVKKTYIALLSGQVTDDEGTVTLPLCPDVNDRPRQMVDVSGKPAVTHWRVLARCGNVTRIEFRPVTGRTHQLRVHASHNRGLGCPIVGDMLYGMAASRLMLHAQELQFIHPFTRREIRVSWPAPF